MLPKWIDCELLCRRRGNRTGRGKFYWTFRLLTATDHKSLLIGLACVAGGILVPRVLSWQRNRHTKRAAKQRGKIPTVTRLRRQKTTARASPLIPPATQARWDQLLVFLGLLSVWKSVEGGKGPLKNVITGHRLDFNSLPPPLAPKWLLSWNHLPTLLSDQMASLGFSTIFSKIKNISSNSYG